MNQYEECPECGNKQLIIEVEEVSRPRYSAKTGKLISKGHCFHTNCCQYTCCCGWFSEPTKYHESLPEIITNRR